MINNITGSPVEGENFFGREKELEYAWRHIKKGNSIILSAPRRVGKSSLAKKALALAKEEHWNTLEINLEEIKTEEDFVKVFLEKLTDQGWWSKFKDESGKKIGQILESIKPSIEYAEVKATLEWKSNKKDVYEKLKMLLDHEKETLIMVDELTVLFHQNTKIYLEFHHLVLHAFLNNPTNVRQLVVAFLFSFVRLQNQLFSNLR